MLNLYVGSQLFEQDPENLPLGVSINQLSKRYKGSVKYALKNFTMNFYEGQITALCGKYFLLRIVAILYIIIFKYYF